MNIFKKWVGSWNLKTTFNVSDKTGPGNLDRAIEAIEKFDNYNSNPLQLNKDLNGYLWFYSALLLVLEIALVWIWAWHGFIAGIFFSVSILFIARTVHCSLREVAIHPGGIHGYNFTQAHLKKNAHLGSRLHNIFRKYLMYRWYYFLYTESGKHWSYRPYVLILLVLWLFYWSPLIGFSFISLFIAAFIFLAANTRMPISFFMASSHPDSHILFKKIRGVSRIKWVSLLHDGVSLSEPPKTVEDQVNMLDIMALTNIWSLRMENDSNWLDVVKDFINYSAVVVIKAEQVDAVRQELDILAASHYLERVIVIGNPPSDEALVPEILGQCIMTEESALEILSLTYSNPKQFLERMKNRI